MNLYRTYLLVDPKTKKIRYIGKTKQKPADRLKRHLRDALEKKGEKWVDNTHRANWIRALLRDGVEPKLEELCRYETLEAVNAAEKFFIYHFRSVRNDLTNATDGGDGGIVPRKPVVDDATVIAAYTNGQSSTQIARQYKTCKKRVLSVLKKACVPLRQSGRQKAF